MQTDMFYIKFFKLINFLKKNFIFLTLIFIYLATFSLAFLKYIPISGNYNDIFQINNGYIFGKMKLHQEFHSPFGLFYHLLHFVALKIISFFKMNTAGIVFLSNLLFALLVNFLFFLINKDKSIKKLPNKLLLFLTLIIYNAIFSLGEGWISLSLKFIPPVFYNPHLYTLILLYFSYILSYNKNLNENKLPNNLSDNYIKYKSFISAIFLFISLNYKINFFPAIGILCFAFFLIIQEKKAFFFYTLLFFTLFVFIISIFGYNYISYFKDIFFAIVAGKDNLERDMLIMKLSLVCILILIFTSLVIYFFKKKDKRFNLIIISLLSLGAILTPIGNTAYLEIIKIFSFFILIIILLIKNYKIANYFIFFFAILTVYKYQNAFKGEYINFYFQGKNNNFMGIKIDQELDMFGSKTTQWYTEEILSKNLTQEECFKLSYNILPSFREKIFKTKNFNAHNILPFAMKETEQTLAENKIKYNTAIFDTKLGSQVASLGYNLPKNSLHWPHIGVSISKKDLKKRLDKEIFNNSDIVILSLFDNANTSNNHDDNTLINCFFYEFNNKNNKFKLWKIKKFAVYFVNEKYAKENNLELDLNFKIDHKEINHICDEYIHTALTKKYFILNEIEKLKL